MRGAFGLLVWLVLGLGVTGFGFAAVRRRCDIPSTTTRLIERTGRRRRNQRVTMIDWQR